MATKRVIELQGLLAQDDEAKWVSNLWDKFNNQRAEKLEQWAEVDKYITATDTTTTANSILPWTHKTTVPKLTQIRDNLHANYISSLFPNDKWLSWVAFSPEAARHSVAKVLVSYMENKTREGGFRETTSHLLYDYIDKGNAFAMPAFETRYRTTDTDKVADFVGPKAVRIDPYDIVFDPTAVDFESSPKVVRSIMNTGSLLRMAETDPDYFFWKEHIENRRDRKGKALGYNSSDWQKASQYSVDGFGSLQEYYGANSIEVLEFYGDYYSEETGELQTNRMITIIDRMTVVRNIASPNYGDQPLIRHVGWRRRNGNLWHMGPLDNLVGMQYMLDHYMNMGANALDLKVMSPKKIIGDVEEFVWGPNAEIHIDENGDVQELAQSMNDIFTVSDWIEKIEYRMELYAGAPREAMGVRSPGEKTAFEVQSLENAAGRIFGEKTIQFELFLEKVLNDMLEVAHRNMDSTDLVRIVDRDIGVQVFKTIKKEDIIADGILRPIGARHFSQKAQELQNLVGVFNSPLGELLKPHTSSIAVTKFIEDVVDLRGYNIFKPNIAIAEAQQSQALMQQAEEDNIMASSTSEEELMANTPRPKEEVPQE